MSDTVKTFNTRKEALAYLQQHPLTCVQWNKGNMCAICWNSKVMIQAATTRRNWADL